MPSTISKAMILSAGLGTRLSVITEKVPKPLVCILNIPNIVHTLSLLKKAGVKEVICNIFHLADQMEAYFKEKPFEGIQVSFVKEKVLLGTGGGVKNAEAFFEKQPFILANCDFITDLDITPHIENHYHHRALATMVLHENPKKQSRYSKVGVDSNENICALPKLQISEPVRGGIFTGIHILESKCLSYLENKPSGINEILYPTLMKQTPNMTLGSFTSGAYWLDTGDPTELVQSLITLLDKMLSNHFPAVLLPSEMKSQEVSPGIWASPKTVIPQNVELKAPVLIGEHCLLGEGSKIGPYVCVGNHSTLGKNVQVKNSILLNNSSVTDKAVLDYSVVFERSILPAKPLT